MEKRILICFFTLFIIILCILVFIISKTKYTDEEIINIINDRIQDTNQIVIACDVFPEKRRENNNINTYKLGDLEKIKVIDERAEIETVIDLVNNITLCKKDESEYSVSPACTYIFIDNNNSKIFEYDLEKVAISKLNNVYVKNSSENIKKLKEYIYVSIDKYR